MHFLLLMFEDGFIGIQYHGNDKELDIEDQCGKNCFRMSVIMPPTVIAVPHLRGASSAAMRSSSSFKSRLTSKISPPSGHLFQLGFLEGIRNRFSLFFFHALSVSNATAAVIIDSPCLMLMTSIKITQFFTRRHYFFRCLNPIDQRQDVYSRRSGHIESFVCD
ncbi:MAG: hypothetical protein HQL93_01100 [Magnetococcales bacterium]|nr:hypothetical protein [Magnetococcales bacterium]